MRRRHFDALQPVCPRCALEGRAAQPLALAVVLSGSDEEITEGLLHCTYDACRLEFPIIDGIPIIVPDVRSYIARNIAQIHRRHDLSDHINGLLGDALGPGSELDLSRQHLSIYCRGHYGDLDPDESPAAKEGTLAQCLEQGLSLPIEAAGPVLDLGCSVGRTTFEIAAQAQGLALGIDLNFAMLRAAHRVLQTDTVDYERRRLGLVYDRRCFPAQMPNRDRVDFWACDALALPFADGAYGTVLAMNLLDCVASPRDLLAAIRNLLREGGSALVASPYDWSANATPAEAWIGGHSQRGPDKGAAEPLLRALLSDTGHPAAVKGLSIVGEIDNATWLTHLHDRSAVSYSTHLVALRRRSF